MSRIDMKQKGSIIIVAMLAMVALISLGGLSTLAVRGGLASSGHDRFRAVALYAAESGAAAGVDYLRSRVHSDISIGWTDYVNANNDPPFFTQEIPGNGKEPDELGNLFSQGLPPEKHIKAWYRVEVLNNPNDNGLSTGQDLDQRVIVRSTGFGPAGTTARVEVEITPGGPIGGRAPPVAYSQESQSADNSGFDPGAEAINNRNDIQEQ